MIIDVRKTKLAAFTLSIDVDLSLLVDTEKLRDGEGLCRNLGDELAKKLGERLEETPGLTLIKSDVFTVEMRKEVGGEGSV